MVRYLTAVCWITPFLLCSLLLILKNKFCSRFLLESAKKIIVWNNNKQVINNNKLYLQKLLFIPCIFRSIYSRRNNNRVCSLILIHRNKLIKLKDVFIKPQTLVIITFILSPFYHILVHIHFLNHFIGFDITLIDQIWWFNLLFII